MSRRMLSIGVRRGIRVGVASSGTAPVDPNLALLLASGHALFLDPDHGVTPRVSGPDQFAASILDRAGRYTALTAADARQPLWGANTTPTGRKLLTFDGSDDILTDASDAIASQFDESAPYTLFFVARAHSPSSTAVCVGLGSSSVAGVRIAHQLNADLRMQIARVDGDGTTTSTGPTGSLTDETLHLVTIRYNGSQQYAAWIDDSATPLIELASNTRSPTLDRFSLGGVLLNNSPTLLAPVSLGPVIGYASELDDPSRIAVRNAILAYYLGVTP